MADSASSAWAWLTPRHRRRQLRTAVDLLTPSTAARAERFRRGALVTGTRLARAHIALGNLEQAREIGRTLVQWLPQVHSARCVTGLRGLADDLRSRKGNCHVRDFSAELDHTLRQLA